MTGEMSRIDQDGTDSNGDVWSTHAAVARAVGGELCPFDSYQGPYIVVGKDIVAGGAPYRMPVPGFGVVRLWLISDDAFTGRVYREDNDTMSDPFWQDDEEAAADAARSLLGLGELLGVGV